MTHPDDLRHNGPAIQRTAPRAPDRFVVNRRQSCHVRVMLSPLALFELLGIAPPDPETEVRICLARSHGDEGSLYRPTRDTNLVEIKLDWEEPLA